MVINPQNDLDKALEFFDYDVLKKYNIVVQGVSADDEFLENNIEKSEDYIIKIRYQYFLALLKHLKLVDNLKIAQIADAYSISSQRNIQRFKDGIDNLPDIGAPGGPCIPGARRLFVSTDGTMYPCERVSEVSEPMKIGNVFDGFDVDKAKALLNVASITADKCKNCYAVTQ